MKNLKYIFGMLLLVMAFTACEDGSARWNHVWYDVFLCETIVHKRLQCR